LNVLFHINSILKSQEIKQALQHLQGTEHYYRSGIGNFNYTDGVKWLAQNAECYWLLDIIASYQPAFRKSLKDTSFQLWILVTTDEHKVIKRLSNHNAVVECWADTPTLDQVPLARQNIPFTDFPLSEIKLYLESDVLMLPSER